MLICDISILDKYGKEKLDGMLMEHSIDWRIMVVLLVTERVFGISQASVTPFLQTDKGNVTRILQSIEKSGFIHREADIKDQRKKLCYLLEKGLKLLSALKRVLKNWEDECLSGLTDNEIDLFRKINKTISNNLIGEWK